MNRCKRIRRLVSLFLTDDLDETAARQVRMHLARCPECRQRSAELARSQTALETLRQEAGESKPQPLWPELSQRIARLRTRQGALKGWLPVGALAAACLTVYVLGSGSWPSYSSRPEARIAASTRDTDEDARSEDLPDTPPPDDLRWVGSDRARPVLPNAHPVTLRSSRQF